MNRDQKDILHGGDMSLEIFARSIFGEKYFGSAGWTNTTTWRKFYVSCLEVIGSSFSSSVGYVDPSHKAAIDTLIKNSITKLKKPMGKDKTHIILIVSLFKLVFLLIGRSPYSVRGKKRDMATFRTLTYSQTEEQLSWLLQGYIQGAPQAHGFTDAFDADFAFLEWAKINGRKQKDRSAFVDWVRQDFPETLRRFS